MAPEGWMTVTQAAERLGLGVASVRRLAASGDLKADRVGRQWLIDGRGGELPASAVRSPGRPFSPRLAWALLAVLDHRAPGHALHRQERARLRGYLAMPRDRMAVRLRGRASCRLLSVASIRIEGLMVDDRWMVGGARAATSHLGRPVEGDLLSLYVRASDEEDFYDVSYAVPDARMANLCLRVVEDASWPFGSEGERYVWPTVSYLDCFEHGLSLEGLDALWPAEGAGSTYR